MLMTLIIMACLPMGGYFTAQWKLQKQLRAHARWDEDRQKRPCICYRPGGIWVFNRAGKLLGKILVNDLWPPIAPYQAMKKRVGLKRPIIGC